MAGWIVPKKKRSQSKKRTRHSDWQTTKIKYWMNRLNIVKDKDTGNMKLWHRVDLKTGYYNGKQVMTIKSKSKDKVVEA